jgi:hypothetical protein
MNLLKLALSLLLLNFTLSELAFARRGDREGFNFGSGLRLLDTNDRSLSANENQKSSNTATSGYAVTPYFGYVLFDTFNVGLAGLFESSSADSRELTQDNRRVERTSETALKAGSLFGRFLFAKFFYFEGGIGVYNQKTNVKNEYTSETSKGSFEGEHDEYSTDGVGLGYNVGAGLELSITNGFFFTTNYMVRSFQLRDGGESIGKKRARMERRELNFGLCHYVN